MPKVSIIVPNYNHSRFLNQRFDTILNQTCQDFEIIMLDDCSTDNSIVLLNSYSTHPKVSHYIINESNSGSPFQQWDRGIELAKGDYIWIAESDDFAESAFLSELIEILENDYTLNFAFCKSNWINEKNEPGNDLSIYKNSFKKNGPEEIKTKLVHYNTIQNVSSVLFRTSILKKISKRYTQYRSCGDWILYTENLLYGNFCFTEKVLNNFRWYHDNVSNTSGKQGLWIYEGVDVLKIAKRNLKFKNSEKAEIIKLWIGKIKNFMASNPFPLNKFIIVHLKLFFFAPVAYCRLISLN